jgi:hypothetical protein
MTSHPHPTVLRAEAVSLQGASPELSALLGVLTFPVFLAPCDQYVHVSPVCTDLDTLEASSIVLRDVLPLLESSHGWCSLCSSRKSAEFFMESLHEAATLVRLEALAETVEHGSSLRLLGVLYEEHRSVASSRRPVSSLAKDHVLRASRAALTAGAAHGREELSELAAVSLLASAKESAPERLLLELAREERLSALENPQRLAAVARVANCSTDAVSVCAAALVSEVKAVIESSSKVVLCGVRNFAVQYPALAGQLVALFALEDVCTVSVPGVVAEYASECLLGPWRTIHPSPLPADALASSLQATWSLLRTRGESDPFATLDSALEAASALLSPS